MAPQIALVAKSDELAPPAATYTLFRLPVPVLATVKDPCAGNVTCRAPKSNVVASPRFKAEVETEPEETAPRPTPVTNTGCGEPLASSVTISVALAKVLTTGENVTLIVQ